MYNIIIWYLYIQHPKCTHHPKFSFLLYHIFHLLYPVGPSPYSLSSGNISLLSVSFSLFLFLFLLIYLLFFVLYSTYKWNHTVLALFHLIYFTYHNNILKFHPCHCKWQYFIFLYGLIVLQCIDTTSCLHSQNNKWMRSEDLRLMWRLNHLVGYWLCQHDCHLKAIDTLMMVKLGTRNKTLIWVPNTLRAGTCLGNK